jgi:hypothetical protein
MKEFILLVFLAFLFFNPAKIKIRDLAKEILFGDFYSPEAGAKFWRKINKIKRKGVFYLGGCFFKALLNKCSLRRK